MLRLLIVSALLVAGLLLFNQVIIPPGKQEKSTAVANNSVGPISILIDSVRAKQNYTSFCGGCHGEKMDAFVDRQWKHGNTREDLFKAIKSGYADEGMPAFDTAFTDEEMYELSDYMLKGIENFKRYEFMETEKKENFFPSADVDIRLDTIVRGLKSIWAMAFLPDGKMLITEKSGKVYLVGNNKSLQLIEGAPELTDEGQGGLMDIVLHPDFKKNKLLYLSYSAEKKEGSGKVATTAITRMKLQGNKLVEPKLIFEAFPFTRTRHHYGSRMVFDKDGYLYFSVGERGNEKEYPQNLNNDLGKIHRIKDDGSIPADNPFVNTPGARPSIYSYGHRNPQGLTVNPTTGEIWSNEHGPRGGDEINLVQKGLNYGWPVVTYGINYNGKIISNITTQEGIEEPLIYWIPSIAPSGMAFVTGKRYKSWEGNLLSGSLRFKYLNLSRINGHKVTSEEMLLKNIGRLRDVRMGPDGYLYVAVEQPGYVFRLVPVKR